MYRLDVSKGPVTGYVVSVSKQGSCVEDHISLEANNVGCLLAECANIISHGVIGPTLNEGKVALDTHGNAYQLIAHVSENYVKAYYLTLREIKLFQASLKRAVDG